MQLRRKPLPTKVPPGTLAFGNGLLVRFHEDNHFWVYNGRWEGMFDGEQIYIPERQEYWPVTEPFKQVDGLTMQDREDWYFGRNTPIVPKPTEDDDQEDEIPF